MGKTELTFWPTQQHALTLHSSLLLKNSPCMIWTQHVLLSTHQLIDVWSCPLFGITDNAAMNIHVQVFVWTYFSFLLGVCLAGKLTFPWILWLPRPPFPLMSMEQQGEPSTPLSHGAVAHGLSLPWYGRNFWRTLMCFTDPPPHELARGFRGFCPSPLAACHLFSSILWLSPNVDTGTS